MRALGPRRLLPALLLAALLAPRAGLAQALPGAGDRVLERADALLAQADSSYRMRVSVAIAGVSLEYLLKVYVKDGETQRALFESPDFDRGDSAIRRGAVAYLKYHAWPKYDAMSSRSSFLDSPLTWEDALCPALAPSYELASASWDSLDGERLLRCELSPRRPGGYRRIELWLQGGSYRTVKRIYYTPSGIEWKTATYSFDGSSGWEMRMVDDLTKASVSMKVGDRAPEAMPDSFFDPRAQVKEK